MAGEGDVSLREGERAALGDVELLRYEVEAGRRLRDGMLDLDPRVDLEEGERLPVDVDEELDGPEAPVAETPAQPQRRLVHRRAQPSGELRGGGLLEELLIAALDRAVTLADVQDPLAVREELDLDVPAPGHVALQVDGAVLEGAACLGHRQLEGEGELAGMGDEPHPAPAAPADRLHEHRQAGALQHRLGLGRVPDLAAGEDRQAGGDRCSPGLQLVAEHAKVRGGRPDEEEAGFGAGVRERRVLREEAVTGMDRGRPGRQRGPHDGVHRQVAPLGRGWSEAHHPVR